MQLTKKYLLYYALLFLILLSWHNPYETPPEMYRVLYLIALLGPITVKKPQLFAIVIPLFYAVSNYSCFISYMPNQVYLYLAFPIVALIFYHRKTAVDSIALSSLFFAVYTIIINAAFCQRFESISACCLLVVLLHKFLPHEKNNYAHLFSFSFSIMSFTLSLLFIFAGTMFQVNFGAEDFERTEWMDPNYFGCIVGIGVVASMIELLYNKRLVRYERVLFLLSIFISLYVLVLNGSRGALLATSLSFLVLFMGNGIRLKKKVLILGLLCIFLYILYTTGMFDFLIYRIENDSGGGSGRTFIWEKKLLAYKNQLAIIEKILGIGYNEGMHLAFGYSRGFHNDYIAILVEYGIVGTLLFAFLLLSPLINSCNKILVLAVVVYTAMAASTLEPISGGMIMYFCFLLYAYVIGKSEKFGNTRINSII